MGIGRWLSAEVFRDEPERSRVRSLPAAAAALAGLLLVGVQLLRVRSSAPLDSLWAEDGFSWLHGALHHGLLDTLSTSSDGYLQTVSRLVAWPVSKLPVRWFAPSMALSGAVIVAGCVGIVWRCSAAYISRPWLRAALCLLIVLTPAAGVEVFANVTNTIWFILFAAFWLLLWRPASLAAACAAGGLLLLAALSTAGVILLGPVWLLRALAVRDRRDAVIVAAPLIGSLAQLPSLLSQTYTYFTTPTWSFELFPAYAQRVLGGGVLGNRVAGAAWKAVGVSLEIALAVVAIVLVTIALTRLRGGVRVLVGLMVVLSVELFVVSGYQRGIVAFLLWPARAWNAAEARYAICPSLLLISALLLALDDGLRRSAAGRWRTTAAGVIVALVALALTSLTPSDHAFRGRPRWSSSVTAATRRCEERGASSVRLPVSPFGSLEVPCRRL
jgi:hypothetical protein